MLPAVLFSLLLFAPQQAPPVTPVATPAPDQPVTHLFQNLARDLRALPSSEAGGVLLAGAAAALAAHRHDVEVADWARRQPSSPLATFGNTVGNGWTQAGGAFAVWIAGEASHSANMAHLGSDLIRAQALNGVINTGIKVIVNRDRPTGSAYSFPSGHTSATFASAAVVQHHLGWKAGAAAYAAASFVGWSRVRSYQHWLSDVAFAASVGIVSGRAVTRAHPRQWTMTPVTIRGGIAVFVTRQPGGRP